MSDATKVPDRLGQAVSVLYAAVLILAIVMVLCSIGLILAGTYGILHNGNDFDGTGAGGALVAVPCLLWLILAGCYAPTHAWPDFGGFSTRGGAGLVD